MSLTRQEVEKIAHLARLALTEEQITEYQEQLSSEIDRFGVVVRKIVGA